MKRKEKDKRLSHSPARRKLSELVCEFAGDFIGMANSPEQRQNHLNAACSAWNIACNPPEQRQKILDRYLTEYLRYNPHTDPANAAAIRSDMEKLIAQKLKLFPKDKRQILNAQLVSMGDQDRIEVVSARME